MALWGATPIATKFAVAGLTPLAVGMLRTALAAVLTVPLLIAWRLRPPRRPQQLALLSMVTLGALVGFPLLFSLGVGRTSATHAGLILAALPLPTGLLGAAFERVLPPPAWWLGAAVALLGEALLMSTDTSSASAGASLAGDLLVAAGAFCAATGHVAGARLAPSFGTWPTTLWAITAGGALLLPAIWWRGDLADLAAAGRATWSAMLFLAGGSTLLAFAAWYWALSRGGIARMGALQFLQPLVTLALAALLLAEPITPSLMAAAGLILAGVALTQRRSQGR